MRAHVDAKIAGVTAQLVRVRVVAQELVAASLQAVTIPPGARLTVEPDGRPPDPHEPPISTTDLDTPLLLDPGGWRVRLELPGYEPVSRNILLADTPADQVWQLDVTRKSVTLELRLSPPRAARRARLRATATDRTLLPSLEQPIDGPRTAVVLTTGAWQLDVFTPTHRALQNLVVDEHPRPLEIVLQPRPAGEDKLIKDPKLVLAVAASMGVMFYGGLGFTLGGVNLENKADEKTDEILEQAGVEEDETPGPAALAHLEAAYSTAGQHRDLRRAADLQTAGTVIMTTGLGAVLGVLPNLLEVRRRRAYVAVAVGGAALVGGAVWMHAYLRLRDDRLGTADPARRVDESGLVGHRLGASMILGLGIGLTTGASLVLLTDHLRRRKRNFAAAPLLAPTHAGLLLRGNF